MDYSEEEDEEIAPMDVSEQRITGALPILEEVEEVCHAYAFCVYVCMYVCMHVSM